MPQNELIETIVSKDEVIRNRTLEDLLDGKSLQDLLRVASGLETFRRKTTNLYHRVRAGFFAFAVYRFYLLDHPALPAFGRLPPAAARHTLSGRWEEAIRLLLPCLRRGASAILISALAEAYYRLAFSYLLERVKLSISRSRGNEWMFKDSSLPGYQPCVRDDYLKRDPASGLYPLGSEACPVRVDPCHSGWSDIFFLAMDFPEGARVVNLSVDIAVRGQGRPRPPIECFSRVIEKPVIRLVSLDLRCFKEISTTAELFNFGNDHLSLLKAGVIASGLVPPVFEKKHIPLSRILRRLTGPGLGLELITRVGHLPKGSRLAVSTSLLNSIITCLMRLSGQIPSLEGGLSEAERRLVASRTILGEWLGGSGGGWQDSGGLWPGLKIIEGVRAKPGDPEFKRSRGRLLPRCRLIPPHKLPPGIEKLLRDGIVLIHGGLSQNVGPVLELVTEKYLLRYRKEWKARLREMKFFDRIVAALQKGDMKELGLRTMEDWEKGTKVIIPRASNAFTEALIRRMKMNWGEDCYGFLMLGGAAGGGMAFIVNPAVHGSFAEDVKKAMKELKRHYRQSLPFAMEPVVFDFALNDRGIRGVFRPAEKAKPPAEYNRVFPRPPASPKGKKPGRKPAVLKEESFDRRLHAHNKNLLRAGIIGVKQNRLGPETSIRDIRPSDILKLPDRSGNIFRSYSKTGREALKAGKIAVVTFSGGLGSRWSGGAAVVKALNPFILLKGKHRSFLELHLAKSEKLVRKHGFPLQHVFTTSPLTHRPINAFLKRNRNFGYSGRLYLSRGSSLLQRVYPPARELKAFWEERLKYNPDPQKRRLEMERLKTFIKWSRANGEGEDYNENDPSQRFHPPGHWHEIPHLISNGTLARMLRDNPSLRYLFTHNLDTVGTTIEEAVFGLFVASGTMIGFEVTPRHWGDRGGFLARVDGRPQLLEALAFPRPEDAFKLSYYNSLTAWIDLEKLLDFFGLTRGDVFKVSKDERAKKRVERNIREVERKMPAYVTIKEVRLAWGEGRTDTYPVLQCEKLWGDMTRLKDLEVSYLEVGRKRARQLKDPDLLDHWERDGSLAHLKHLTIFNR